MGMRIKRVVLLKDKPVGWTYKRKMWDSAERLGFTLGGKYDSAIHGELKQWEKRLEEGV